MHLGIPSGKVRASEISVQCDCSINLGVLTNRLARCEILYTVGEEVWVLITENEGPELHDGYESG